jgi:hypothetical protein
VAPIIQIRPVWYFEKRAAVSYDSFDEGMGVQGRAPDAWGTYFIEADGRLVHLFDTPCVSLPAQGIFC